jgi:hypothetical protein
MPYFARREGQSDEEYLKELHEFNERWYGYQDRARKEFNDRMSELARALEEAEQDERGLLGMPEEESEQSRPKTED